MIRRGLGLSAPLVLIALAACPGRVDDGDAGVPAFDAGFTDAGSPDAGSLDAGFVDAGFADAGFADAGFADAGFADAGFADAGFADAGFADAGFADAGFADAGFADAGFADAGVVDAGPRTHGLEQRVVNTTCFLNGAPPVAVSPVAVTPALPLLTAVDAVAVVAVPGTNDLALVESAGRVRSFSVDGTGADAAVVLDLGPAVRPAGLRGAAFRPDGAALIASYLPADNPLRLVIARYPLVAGVADVSEEEILLSIPLGDDTRAGGPLAFLFDGTLVAAVGDGGDQAAANDPASLVGKALRIDVDGPQLSGYTVPADNPFVADPTSLPEIFALDFGAPTSCGVDRVVGRLWCADRFDATKDRIDIVSAGVTLRPILAITRGAGCGAVVGTVSRDAALPDIQGALLFGDSCSTTLSALRFDGSLVRSQGAVASLPASLSAFAEADDGRAFAVDAAGAVFAVVRPAGPPPTAFPTTLSATGCLSDTPSQTPAPSLVPFEVRTPLWSDGAKKHRFIILPGSDTIGFTTTGSWQFPVGTMFMKEFRLDDDNDDATENPIMETRFLVKRTEAIWEGYSYMWDRDRKDAYLLDGAEIQSYAMAPGSVDASGASVHRHTFPDRVQCLLCHNPSAGRALGLQTGRMNTDHDYDGFVENQLEAMDFIGLFGGTLSDIPDNLPRFPDPNDQTNPDVEGRARSWLYANCSHCHQPGGPTPVVLDFRFETPLHNVNACGVTPRFTLSQIPNAKILDPGNSANSEMFFRLSRRDRNQMPPIATLIVDPPGVDVMQQWIDSLTGCP